jgi:hypothetical protein
MFAEEKGISPGQTFCKSNSFARTIINALNDSNSSQYLQSPAPSSWKTAITDGCLVGDVKSRAMGFLLCNFYFGHNFKPPKMHFGV